MRIHVPILNCVIAFTTLVLVCCGCQQTGSRKCPDEMSAGFRHLVPTDVPRVMVVGAVSPREHLAAVHTLVKALHTGLSGIGGLHVESLDSAWVHGPPTAEQFCAVSSHGSGRIPSPDYAVDSGPLIPLVDLPDASAAGAGSGRQMQVRVAVTEFETYRPMKLAATISVVNLNTGEEVNVLQGVWYGDNDGEPLADANCGLQHALKKPQPRSITEVTELIPLSPQLFLQRVAAELVPAIHAACQCPAGITIVEDL